MQEERHRAQHEEETHEQEGKFSCVNCEQHSFSFFRVFEGKKHFQWFSVEVWVFGDGWLTGVHVKKIANLARGIM